MTSYRFFSRWQPAAILDLNNIRPLRSAIVGLSSVLNFGLDRIYIFRDIAIFIFRRFMPFWGGEIWGHIPPNDVTRRSNPQKALSYTEARRFSHKA